MANKVIVTGLTPVKDGGDDFAVMTSPKSTASAYALFIGSPVWLVLGEIKSVVAGHTDAATNGVTGAVVALYDANGTPVSNLAAADAGKVTHTFKVDQTYRTTVSTNVYAEADQGLTYDFTAEASTADTTTVPGNTYSSRQLVTEQAVGVGQMTAGRLIRRNSNDAGLVNAEILCKINLYAPAGA